MKMANQGFTLLELLIVVALISIIGGMAAPGLSEWNCQQNIKTGFSSLSASISQLHGRAADYNLSTRMQGTLDASSNTMTYRFYSTPTVPVGVKTTCNAALTASWVQTTDAPVVLKGILRAGAPTNVCFYANGSVEGDESLDRTFRWNFGRTCGAAKVVDMRLNLYGGTGFMDKFIFSRQQNTWLEL